MTTRRFAVALGASLLLPAAAHANGAMGLALSIFPWPIWLVYVVATVLFEAWWIGRALKIPRDRAIPLSLRANAVTLVLGFIVSGFFGYMLYGTFGSYLNPNPLGQAILLLVIGNLFSALIEIPFWGEEPERLRLWRATFAAHLVGVPLALTILLLPPRPYSGLEGQAAWRRDKVAGASSSAAVTRGLEEVFQETECIPAARSFPELLEQLRPRLGSYRTAPDLWAAAYRPDFARFDTGECRRNPIAWNAALAGKRLDDLPRSVWLYRWREHGYTEGMLLVDRRLARSHDPVALGFTSANP